MAEPLRNPASAWFGAAAPEKLAVAEARRILFPNRLIDSGDSDVKKGPPSAGQGVLGGPGSCLAPLDSRT